MQVTAGVIGRAGKVLVCQRPAGSRHAGKWEFPGGKVELGERIEAGMRRELREELGIDAEVGVVLWCTEHQYPGHDRIILTFFAIPRYSGAIRNCGFADLRWAAISELRTFDFLEADREFIARLEMGTICLQDAETS